jgi:RimJ/RimL family protein N-acetyltransferase
MGFNIDIEPVVLIGNTVKLVPIQVEHAAALYDSTREIEWKMLPTNFTSSAQMESWVRSKVSERINKTSMHFTVMLAKNEKIVGSTGFMDILPEHRILEIGSTWYIPDLWGTDVNPECKFLMLRYAFETLGAIRVQIKTDSINKHSQGAIKKLGAVYEGKLRNHRIRWDGTIRDTMMYSIIDKEWPAVKADLQKRIDNFSLLKF